MLETLLRLGLSSGVPGVAAPTEIIIGKQRNGAVGTVKLAFLEQYTSFEQLARTDDGTVYS